MPTRPPFAADLRAELRRCGSAPWTEPVVVVVNAAMVLGLWFLLPTEWLDLFFTLHGELALPMVLASWMYADVPATNVLAPDPRRSLDALSALTAGAARPLRRLLAVKRTAMWLLVSPVCMAVAVGIGVANGAGVHVTSTSAPIGPSVGALTAITLVWIAVVPPGVLAVSAWVGVLAPYHPLPLRRRWAHRRPVGHMVVRWLTLAVLPYAVVPALSVLVVAPSALYWHLSAGQGLSGPLTPAEFAVGTAITAVTSLGLRFAGTAVAVRLCRRRVDALTAYLSDPARG